MVHFGCTSEDINNLAYGLMLGDLKTEIVCRKINELLIQVMKLAEPLVDVPMIARTHGQVASPTTVGKELMVFASRLHDWNLRLDEEMIYGKMNGAVGNFNAHTIAAPDVDWMAVTNAFVRMLGFEPNSTTTQIETARLHQPHF